MTIDERIFLALGFALGYFFFRYVGSAMNRRLHQNLSRINPDLVKRSPWFFTFMSRFFRLFSWISLVFAVLIIGGLVN